MNQSRNKKKYFDPNDISGKQGLLRLFQSMAAPTRTVADLLPLAAADVHRMQGVLQYAYRFAQPLFKKRKEEVPVPDLGVDEWNTIALFYVAGKIENAINQVPYLTDAAANYVRKNDLMTRMATMGIMVEDTYHTEPPPDFQFEPPTEEEVAGFVRFLQQAQQELMERYYRKKEAKRQMERQVQQQRLEGGQNVGIAKQLGMDTGQPLPLTEYGGATYRHKR